MKNYRLKTVMKSVTSYLLILTMFFSMASPYITQAIQTAENEEIEQQKWRDILSTELGGTDEFTVSDFFDLSGDDETSNIWDDEAGANNADIQEYRTNRFIIKYKSTEAKTVGDNSFAANFAVENFNATGNELSFSESSIIRTETYMSEVEFVSEVRSRGVNAGQIAYIQPDYEMAMSAEEPSNTWAYDKIGVAAAHNITTGNGVTVALLDSGIDTSHPDLVSHIIGGWDFVNNDGSVNDYEWYYDQWHATHIAGIIAGSAPGVKILPLKIFQGGTAYTSDIIEAIEYAEIMGATVANCSWGSRYENRALREAMENSGMLFVCAAGNSLFNIDKYPVYPASFSRELPNVIAVAATDSNDIFSRRSNYGVETVDVAAPGEDIYSTWLEGGYNKTSGTSMAAGFVSGLAALIQSKGTATAGYTKTRLIESSDTITGLRDKIKGGKRINFAYAVSNNPLPNPMVIDVPDDEEIPEIIPYGEAEEDDYEEFGAENFIDIKANMITARHGLQVVELDGKVYAIGGQTTATSGYSNKVEMYDPITDTWSAKANMNAARSYFGAVAYGGKIYIFGGYNGTSYLSSVEVYTPSSNTWATQTGGIPVAISNFSTVINSAAGKVYIMGGTNGTIRNTVYEYTISNNTWATKASLVTARSNHAAFIHNNRYIYLESGSNSNGDCILTSEVYDINTFSPTLINGVIIYAANAVCVNINDRVLSINGRTNTKTNAQYLSFISHNAASSSILSWSYMGSSHTIISRACHGAVHVNGKVYVVGGMNSYGIVNTIEEIDLGWQEKAALPTALKNFSTAENNGRLYVFGGEKLVGGVNERSKDVYEYNPSLNTWTKKADLPFYTDSAVFASAYGKIYLMGGRMSSTATGVLSYITNIYEYNPSTNIWTQKCAPQKQKYSFGSIFFNGKIYSAGGYSSTGSLSSVEIYDPLTNTTTSKNTLPSTMYGNKMFIMNEQMYLVNGSSMYVYNGTADAWTNKNPAGTNYGWDMYGIIYNNLYSLYKNTGSVTPYISKYSIDDNMWTRYYTFNFFGTLQKMECVNNRMYIFTGNTDYSNKMVEYVPPISPWVKKAPTPYAPTHLNGVYINGKIYAVGGTNAVNSPLIEYSPATNTWTTKTSMNYMHLRPAVAATQTKIYVFGGYNTSVNAIANVEEYNPATNTWTNKAALPVATNHAAAAAVNDKIYVFGGKDISGNVLNSVREYNPTTNTWATKTNMPTARYGAGAVAIGGKIYVAGGFKVYGEINPTDVLEVYDPATNTWDTTKAKMPYPVGYGGVGGTGGNMYYICGTDWYNQMTDVLEYSPVLDKWLRWIGPDLAGFGAGVAVTEDGIYYIGGQIYMMIYGTMEFAPLNSIYTASDYLHMGKDYINLTGNFSRTYIDMSVQSPGFTMNFSRTYNSRDDRNAGKGNIISKGWTFGFQGKLDLSGNDAVVRLPDGSGSTFRQNTNGTFTAKDTRSTLTKSGTTYILTTKDQYTYTFNASGYMTQMKDRNGNLVTITVDSSGKPTQVKDQANRTYTITYTSNRISTITDAATGRVVTYAYDAYNRLSSVTDPNGSKTYYTYTTNDVNGYLSGIKDNTNSTVVEAVEYHALNSGETLPRVKKVTNINGNADNYTYNNNEGKLTIKDNNNRTMNTWYDKSMYPIKKTDAENKETLTTYHTDGGINRYGEISSQTDRNGNTTHYDRDAAGNVTRVINPNGSTRVYTYDAKNNLLSEKDEEGKMTYYVYDASGINLTKTAKPLDGVTPYTSTATQSLFAIESYAYYTSSEANTMCGKIIYGLLKTSTNGESGVTTYTYDANGYVKTVKDASNNTTTYTYNGAGFLTKEQTPKGYAANYYYDKNGRLLKRTLHGGETDRYIYNALGDLMQHILPKQYAASNDTTTFTAANIVSTAGSYSGTAHGFRYEYNAKRQLTKQTNPNGYATAYTYDVYGNVLTETKPNGGVYTYTYDAMNRVKTATFKETSSSTAVKLESYNYIINTNGTTKTETTVCLTSDSDTAVTANTYDYAGRLLKTDNADGTNTRIEYYGNGLPKVSYDAKNYATQYKYNGLNLLEGIWNPVNIVNGVVKYDYTGYTYDKCGRIINTNYGKTKVDLYVVPATLIWKKNAYNANGTLKEETNSGGGKSAYTYDADGNMTREDAYRTATVYNTVDYTYNHLNKPTQRRFWVNQADIHGQSGTGTMYSTTVYTYDLNGNMLTEKDANNITTTYAYDQMNNLLSSSRPGVNESGASVTITKSMTYDNMGNIATSMDANGSVMTYTYDKRGNLTKTTNALSGVSMFAYDRAGRKTAEVSPANYKTIGVIGDMSRTEYAYDKMGRVLTKTEKYIKPGTTTTWVTTVAAAFEYDGNGNLTKQYDALGWKASTKYFTAYTYDMQNRVLTVKDPVISGYTAQYVYDGLGRKTSETDARGNVTTYAYNDLGYITSAASGSGTTAKTLTKTYDLLGNILTTTDGNGKITTYTYNGLNKLKTAVLPSDSTIAANTVTYRYTIDGKPANEIDSLSHEILYAYDANGRLSAKTSQHSNGTGAVTLTYKYDKNGNLRYETDGRGNITTYAYDALSRAVSVANTVNGTVRTSQKTYNANGNVTAETDWYGNQRKYEYDPLGRVIKRTDESNVAVETLEYNENGAQIKSTDALGKITTYEYDKLERLTKATDPLNRTKQTSYDGNGNALTLTDGKGYVMTYAYDSFDRLTTVKDPDNNTLYTYEYDKNDNMVKQTDRAGTVTTMAYNARNLLTGRTQGGATESRTYRADGSVATSTDRKGKATTYSYDIHGRLTGKTKDGAAISYSYDADGNELTMTGGGQTTARTYDALNRVLTKTVTVSGGSYTTTFQYDITAGQPTGYYAEKTTDAKGNITTKAYDKTKRLATVTAGTAVTTYLYYANGATQKVTYPGGVYAEYAYYANGQLQTLANKKANGSIMESYNYGYDANGNMTQKLDEQGQTNYTYDKLDRVLTVSEPNGRVTTYAYNTAGDRSSETVAYGGATITKTYTYNARGWLTQTVEVSGQTTTTVRYTYDANGNQMSSMKEVSGPAGGSPSGGLSNESDYAAYYEYDRWDNMTQSVSGGGTTEYAYDGAGLRYGKRADGGAMTVSLYEYDDVILEINAATGAQTAVNVYGNRLISRNGDYFMYNGNGDVTAIVDSAGNIKATYYYDAFGTHTSVTGSASNPYRYAGYMYDEETGLYYLKSRYYDPETARFLSEDTYKGNVGDPLSLNLYAYCHYNPLRYFDPLGHYVSPTDQANLTTAQIKQIAQYTADWEKANAAYQSATTQAQKDAATKAMQAANTGANAVRATAGYSGGTTGNAINVSQGNTVNTVNLNNSSSLTNNGKVNTVNVQTGATTTVNNNGSIGTVNNAGNTTVNNNGIIGTVNNSGYIAVNNSGSIGTINNSGSMNINNGDGGKIGTVNASTGSTTGIVNAGTVNNVNIGTGSNAAIYNGGTVANISITNKETNTVTVIVPDQIIVYVGDQVFTGKMDNENTAAMGNNFSQFTRYYASLEYSAEVSRGPTRAALEAYYNDYSSSYYPIGIFEWALYLATTKGILSPFYYLTLGTTRDKNGIFHIGQDSWQKFFGYANLYDSVFDTATSMMATQFQFTHDNTEFNLWAWKGDYLSLGAGAEIGIYYDSGGWQPWPWDCGTQYAMPMSLRLLDRHNNEIFYWKPGKDNWWITGFCPTMINVEAQYLTARYSIDFSGNIDLFESFYNTWNGRENNDGYKWVFDKYNYTAILEFK